MMLMMLSMSITAVCKVLHQPKGSTASLLHKWQDESGVVAEILVDLVASGEMWQAQTSIWHLASPLWVLLMRYELFANV